MGKEIAIKVMVLYNHYRVFNRFLTPYELKTAIAQKWQFTKTEGQYE